MKRTLTAIIVGAFALASSLRGPIHAQPPPMPQPPRAPGAPSAPSVPGVTAAQPSTATSEKPTAAIRGRVTAADNGAPIRGAQIRLSISSTGGPLREGRTAVTNQLGVYEFKDLAAGRFMLSAAKTGFVGLEYGVKPPLITAREPIDLAAAQVIERADFILPRGGVVVVTVADPSGEPLAGVQVDVLQWRFANGQRTLQPSGTSAETNDLGRARVHGLVPGDYYVSVRPGFGSGNTLYVTTYYPGTLSPVEAQRVPVAAARETSIEVRVVAAKPARISGAVRLADGTPIRESAEAFVTTPNAPPSYNVSLRQETPGGGFSSNTIPVRADGSFELRNVVPGEYSIEVGPSLGLSPNPLQEYAHVPLTIAASDGLTGLVVTTQRGATLRGQLTFESGRPPDNVRPDALRVGVFYTSAQVPSAPARTTMHDDYSFEITGVMAPALLRVQSSTTWATKSVEIEGKDATQTPFAFELGREYKDINLLMTDKRATLTGQVTDVQGRPVKDFAVVLFPEDRALWYPRNRVTFSARPGASGGYRIETIPEGTYLAIAVDRLEIGEEQDVELLPQLAARATRVALRDGETRSLNLRLTEGVR